MTAAAYIAVMVIAWLVMIALVVAIFHAQQWLDETIDEEMDAIAPAPCGLDTKGQREER